MTAWQENTLGRVAKIQTGPFGSQLKNDQYITGGTPVVTVEHIDNFRVADFDYPSVTEQDKERLSRYLLRSGDIVFTRVGSVDLSAYIRPHQDGWMFSSRMLRVRPNENLDARYLSYFFQQKSFRENLLSIAVGATMPSINTEILEGVSVTYPSLVEQKAIAAVLSSLDDKIDLLHRQNKTLEAMAETLFRQRFVEEAQENWEEKSLLDLVELVGGGTPKTSMEEYWDGDIPWLSGGDIATNHKGFISISEKTITKAGLENSSAKLLPKFATVISARGTVGKFCLLAGEMAFSQSNYGILPRIKDCYFFTYLLVNHLVEELQSAAYGSVFDTITTSTFREAKFAAPPVAKVLEFEDFIASYFDKKLVNQTQIRTLEKLRDTLLPKLMSGEVRVAA